MQNKDFLSLHDKASPLVYTVQAEELNLAAGEFLLKSSNLYLLILQLARDQSEKSCIVGKIQVTQNCFTIAITCF